MIADRRSTPTICGRDRANPGILRIVPIRHDRPSQDRDSDAIDASLVRALQASLASLAAAGLLILFGHSLQSPPMMVMTLLVLVILSRALQANHYGLFVLQTSLCFVLLAESLSQDWHLAEVRLLNALIGVALTLTVALLIHGLRLQLNKQDKTRDGSQ